MERKKLQKMRKEIQEHLVNQFGKKIETEKNKFCFFEKGKGYTSYIELRYLQDLHMLYVYKKDSEKSDVLEEMEKEIHVFFKQKNYPCLLLVGNNVSYVINRMENVFSMLSPLFNRDDFIFEETGFSYTHDVFNYGIKLRINFERHMEVLYQVKETDTETIDIPVQTLTSQKQVFRFLENLDKEAKRIETIKEELQQAIWRKPFMEFRKEQEDEELVVFEIEKKWCDVEGETYAVSFSSENALYNFSFPDLQENTKQKILFTSSRISESFSVQNEIETYFSQLDPYFFVSGDKMFFLGNRYLHRFYIAYKEEKGTFLFSNRNNNVRKTGTLEEIREFAMLEAKKIYQENRMKSLYGEKGSYRNRIEFSFHLYTTNWNWEFIDVSEEEVEKILQKEYENTMVIPKYVYEKIEVGNLEFLHYSAATIQVRKIRKDEHDEQNEIVAIHETA